MKNITMKNNKQNKESFVVYGKHAVYMILEKHIHLVECVLFTSHVGVESSFNNFLNILNKNKITLSEVSTDEITKFSGSEKHQGICVKIKNFPYTNIGDFIEQDKEKEKSLVVVLDHLEDPHNVGAIARTACGLSAEALFVPEYNQAPVDGSAIKISVGSIFSIPVVKFVNMAQTLKVLKDNGYWVYGLDMNGTPIDKVSFSDKVAIVVGNEHDGMKRLTTDTCDEIISLPQNENLESYNASVAASLAMYEYVRQMKSL